MFIVLKINSVYTMLQNVEQQYMYNDKQPNILQQLLTKSWNVQKNHRSDMLVKTKVDFYMLQNCFSVRVLHVLLVGPLLSEACLCFAQCSTFLTRFKFPGKNVSMIIMFSQSDQVSELCYRNVWKLVFRIDFFFFEFVVLFLLALTTWPACDKFCYYTVDWFQ